MKQRVRLIKNAPTSLGRLLAGAVVRLPPREAAALLRAKFAEPVMEPEPPPRKPMRKAVPEE